MKKYMLTAVLTFFLTSVIAMAQEVKPKFEKQDDLVKATYFHENGTIKEVGYFKDNKLHNQWISYDETGKKITIAHYDLGKKVGTWYVTSNDTVKELRYENNKLLKVENAPVDALSAI